MLKEGELVGVVSIFRREVSQFTDKQIELVQTFADQAVIAIENTRLLNELRQRTDDLSESLEQQTATSEVLRVINSSPGELEPVFQTMLKNATRLCEAEFGNLFLYDGEAFRTVALYQASQAYAEARQRPFLARDLHPDVPLVRIILSKAIINIADVRTERAYVAGDPEFSKLVDVAGARTLLLVPLLKETQFVGAFAIYRKEVRQFADKQIALVQNFAAQAVIAIENARLLNELRQRTDDLSESLQQQTAAADVLKVISSSPGELEPVFEAMLANAVRLCESNFGALHLHESGTLRMVASHNVPSAFAEARGSAPFQPSPESALGKTVRTKQTAHLEDLAATRGYAERYRSTVDAVELGGVRTTIAVPMLKDDELIGTISIFRQQVRAFTDKQIAVIQNFAAQAVIAIENARLLNELRQRTDDLTESLEQQTATSDVLQVISSSPGELAPVFDAMLENATRICEANLGGMFLYEKEFWRPVALRDVPPKYAEWLMAEPRQWGPGTALYRLAQSKELVQI
jgi:GAF domain-containing protein